MSEERDLTRNGAYLAAYGAKLIDRGYAIVPIAPGKKAPVIKNWRGKHATKPMLNGWLSNGHDLDGVGILTDNTPVLDLDIRNEEVADEVEAKVRELIGDAPMKVGQAPKRAFIFRTEKPFSKKFSNKYVDEWGDTHQIEVLCAGQQTVCYHVHPDTHAPYTWSDDKFNKEGDRVRGGILFIDVDELPVLTEEKCDELIAWFHERAEQESDWKRTGVTRANRRFDDDDGVIDSSNPFVEDTPPIDITEEELRARLMMVPHPEDYKQWIDIGMALYHQFSGHEEGLELWHEWAETADNYDKGDLDEKWGTFSIKGKKRAPLTARYILELAKEAVVEQSVKLTMKLRDMFSEAKDEVAWNRVADKVRGAEIDTLTRSSLAQLAKDSLDRITGNKTPLVDVKRRIAYVPNKDEEMPRWVSTWVYDTTDDKFYCTERKITTSKQGFDAMYDRKAMTKKDVLDGKSAPSSTASALALNFYKIQTIQGRRYAPGEDSIFEKDGSKFANTYPEHLIPKTPEKLTPRDIKAVERVKNHVRHLLKDKRERRLFVDWLSWIVQNPGKHANWAILLQGTEGDGKSFFGFLMQAVMGISNVRFLNAHSLESNFTDWAVGQCLTCVEEVRLIKSHNKYEIINRIKPYITNPIVEVHPKGAKGYMAENTTSYLFFSNYQDALPIDEDSRRYCILFSQWQSKAKLDEFLEENPDYYTELYKTIQTSAGALRKWLLEHTQADDFNPFGNAPMTKAKTEMIRRSMPEFILQLDELIRDRIHVLISDELLSTDVLAHEMYDRGMDAPKNKAMAAMLMRAKFERLDRIRIYDGERHHLYSRVPDDFRSNFSGELGGDMEVDVQKIRNFVKKRESELVSDDEL